jgi:hypothetical protein
MSLAIPIGGGAGGALQVIQPNLELSLKHSRALLAAATGSTAEAVGAGISREDLVFAVAQLDRVNGERVAPSDAARLATYILMAVPQPDGPGLPILAAELAEAIEGYPPEIAAAAAKELIRKRRGRIYVAGFIEAAEEAIEPRRQMLRGARRLLAACHRRDTALAETNRWKEQRRAELEAATAAIRARWGAAVPAWFDLQSAYWGAGRAKVAGWPMLIAEAAGRDHAAALVHLRRGCAIELTFAAGVTGDVAKLLAAGDDAGAHRLVEAVPALGAKAAPANGPPLSREITEAIHCALGKPSCRRAAVAEGLMPADEAAV